MQVLIIEDERKICELLVRLIEWETMGFHLLGYVCDGQEGYEKIIQEKPDIVITDIRMPTLSGLDIIRQVREEKIPCHFIVISGYQQFEYAKTALQYHVDDYLLKPINKEELTITLEKVAERILKKEERILKQKNLQKDVHEKTVQLKRRFLMDFIKDPFHAANMSADEVRKKYYCDFAGKSLQLIIVKADCVHENIHQFFPLILGRSQKLFQRCISETREQEISWFEKDYLLILLMGQNDMSNEEIVRDYARQLDRIIASYEGLEICVCPGSVVSGLGELPLSLQEARRSVRYRVLRKSHNFCKAPIETGKSEERQKKLIADEEIYELKNDLEKRDLDQIKDRLRILFSQTEHHCKYMDPQLIYEMLYEIVDITENSLKFSEDESKRSICFAESRLYIRHSVSVPSLLYAFRKAYIKELKKYFLQSEQQGNRPIRAAIQYITAHYGEALTLEAVSEAVHLSPNYFSTMFKKEMDISFIDYLTNYRLGRAKKLLRETDESIAVIAEKVGYSDARYFSRLFSKTFGITPNKYRKL